jgi:hypothetical protein
LLLICRDCRRRKNGPRRPKPKALASESKALMKAAAFRGRIVLTTCLKLCPDNATAVAFVAPASTPRIVAIESRDHLQAMLPRLIGRRP